MTESNDIGVVLISDNNYVVPTAVAINSLRVNRSYDTTYNIYVLCNKVSEDNKKRLNKLSDKNFNVVFIDLENNKKFEKLTQEHLDVTTSALYKFMIPEILSNLQKVIYIDGDVIIQNDLVDLFKTNVDSSYGAVVKDGPKKSISAKNRHSFWADSNYFNSGMMLLNLKLLREENVPMLLIEYRLKGYNFFMDQDAFNVIFKGRVEFLPYHYNLLLGIVSQTRKMNSIEEISEYYNIPKVRNIEQYFEDAKILHFTAEKPWKFYDIPQSEKWINYYNNSPFSDMPLDRESYLGRVLTSKSYRIGKLISCIPQKARTLITKIKRSISIGN